MDIGRAFTYPFEDKDWLKKIAIGGLVALIPIVNFIAIGYAFRQLRNLLEGQELPLPEWDDWGGDFMLGLIPAIAAIVYVIPGWILQAIGGALTRSDSGFVTLLGLGFVCLTTLYGIAYAAVLPAMYVQYARTREFNAFFQFREIFDFIREHLRDYIIAVLMIIVASIAASIVGGILCGIGMAWTGFVAGLVSAHLLAQVARGTEPMVPPTATDTTTDTTPL